MGKEENAIQDKILKALLHVGGLFWRTNSGAFRGRNGRPVKCHSMQGVPDILGCYRGRFIGIEVKTPKGTQSKPQKTFETLLGDAQGIYILADDLDDVLTVVRGIR